MRGKVLVLAAAAVLVSVVASAGDQPCSIHAKNSQSKEELTAMAKDLTEFNADGSIKVAGFVPWFGNYYVNGDPLNHSIAWDADWYNDDGTAAMGSDPDWAEMFRWQKDLVDWYGVDKLKKFVAGQGDEWGESSQDFQNGRIAMAIDGEWRTAFIANGTPGLN